MELEVEMYGSGHAVAGQAASYQQPMTYCDERPARQLVIRSRWPIVSAKVQ